MPQQIEVQPKAPQQLSVHTDELWSFVDNKGIERWVWLALDTLTRKIVGCYIGARSEAAHLQRRTDKPGQSPSI